MALRFLCSIDDSFQRSVRLTESDSDDSQVFRIVCGSFAAKDRSPRFLHCSGVTCCFSASTNAPDDNNLVVMGANAEDMSFAVNYLIEQGGGQVVVEDGKVIEFLPLPVGGIVSDDEPEVVAAKEAKIDEAARYLGSDLPNPMMYMFFLPITAIPDYALTDAGPVDYCALTTYDPILELVEK